MKRRYIILIVVLVSVLLLSLKIGPTKGIDKNIILNLRLPRLILSILVGGSLGLVGTSLQGILLNPLADPYILGIASGAAFGSCLSIVIGVDKIYLTPVFSFAGAIFAMFVVYSLASFKGKVPKDTLLLSGVLVGFFFSSLVMLIMVIAGKELHHIIYILMGNLGIVWQRSLIPFFILFLVIDIYGIVLIYSYRRELNILSLGEERAKEIGVDADKIKKTMFIISSLLIGMQVSICGQIGFVGLVVPHIARLMFGPDHKVIIPTSFILGPIIVVIADTVARTVAPFEIPVGVITSLFGVPFFAYLLRKRKS